MPDAQPVKQSSPLNVKTKTGKTVNPHGKGTPEKPGSKTWPTKGQVT